MQNNDMNIFAIDLGNKMVKMKSGKAEYSYSASYMTTDFLTPESLKAHQEIQGNQIYKLSDDVDASFVWGEALEIYNLPEKMIDTYARHGRMKQKKTQRLLEFAIGRLALDYKENTSEDSPLVVHIMLGLSITDTREESGTEEVLKKMLVGTHQIQINGENLWVNIPSENHISMIPQYMGTLLNMSFDDRLNPVQDYVEGRLGIVDIGGGTILVNSVNALNLSPDGVENFYGIQTLIKKIARDINSTKDFIVEKLLHEGSSSDGYFYTTSRNKKDTRDITDVVCQAINYYTRFTVAPLITETFPDLEEFDCILMTGGGASVISKTALQEEIGEDYFDKIIFVDNPELSNVRGFYKGAAIKWEGNVTTPQDQEENQKEAITLVLDHWGTSHVEFNPQTNILTVYTGEINSSDFPTTIDKSKVSEIVFAGEVSISKEGGALFGGERYHSLDNAMVSLKTLIGMENVNTSSVTDMSFMFNGCKNLQNISLDHFDTSKVTNFSNMFANCSSLGTLDLHSFNTSSVRNFDSMFLGCRELKSLNINTFKMKPVTKIDMLKGCTSLENIELPEGVTIKGDQLIIEE